MVCNCFSTPMKIAAYIALISQDVLIRSNIQIAKHHGISSVISGVAAMFIVLHSTWNCQGCS